MNKFSREILTAIVLTTVCLGGTTYAQSSKVIKTHIPFEFTVGSRTFPAGDYSVTEPMQNFLTLRDGRGRTVASAFTNGLGSSNKPDTTLLRFVLSDGQYMLAEVWQPEQSPAGQQLLQSKSRNAVAKKPGADSETAAFTGTKP